MSAWVFGRSKAFGDNVSSRRIGGHAYSELDRYLLVRREVEKVLQIERRTGSMKECADCE